MKRYPTNRGEAWTAPRSWHRKAESPGGSSKQGFSMLPVRTPGLLGTLLFILLAIPMQGGHALPVSRTLPDPYYPQKPEGELRLNYYYDRTGRWVKFSDWIPFQQKKYSPRFFEDYYELYGLSQGYRVAQLKENIYFLFLAQSAPFRHPRNSLCKIETEEQFHKYRNLMFMQAHLMIMRMYLRLGSLFDKRHLYFHDLDFADDLEISFLIARTYYREAEKYWASAKRYAEEANKHRFEIDLPQIETTRFEIVTGELDFQRIIHRHKARVDAKLEVVGSFLDEEGRPRPVKLRMLNDIQNMYDDDFTSDPLEMPRLNEEWKEKPLFPGWPEPEGGGVP